MSLFDKIKEAQINLQGVIHVTPCMINANLSERYNAKIYLKREDLQVVRSYKIRGAYTKMSSLEEKQKALGIVCASAGNHAQGVALSCKLLKIHGVIYMPTPTPKQKINQVKMFGEQYVSIAPLLWKYALATSIFAIANIFAYYFLSIDKYVPVIISAILGTTQIGLIIAFHNSLDQVVMMQIIAMAVLLIFQLIYFFYYHKSNQLNLRTS